MKKETNPKAKRNGLWCNVLIVAALLLIVSSTSSLTAS